jgi:hypothetical protein
MACHHRFAGDGMGRCTIVWFSRTLIWEYAGQRLHPQAKRKEQQFEPSHFFASCGHVFGHDRRATPALGSGRIKALFKANEKKARLLNQVWWKSEEVYCCLTRPNAGG